MLYNKSTGKPKVGMLELDSLIEWLEQQPTDGTYSYISSRDCLMAQYFKAKGLKNVRITPHLYRAGYNPLGDSKPLPKGWERISIGLPAVDQQENWTYGRALERARALQQKERIAA